VTASPPEPRARPKARPSDRGAEVLLVLAGAGLLLWPALANGFPLVFMDSAWYLAPGFGAGFHPGRAVGYSFFAGLALGIPSIWSIVVVQAALTSLLLVRLARAWASGRAGLWLAGSCLAAVVLVSGAAKYTSWIMADVTAAWLFLGGALWLASRSRADRALGLAALVVALLTHNTHPPLALAGGIGVAGVSLLVLPRGHRGRRDGMVLGAIGLGALPLALFVNTLVVGEAAVGRGTSAFLANRFLDTGVLLQTLDAYCDERPWELCRYRRSLEAHTGQGHDWLLFGPERVLGRKMDPWRSEELDAIVGHALLCCAGEILRTTAVGTWKQLWAVESADGLTRRTSIPMAVFMARRMPWERNAFLGSDQHRGRPVRVVVHGFPEAGLQAVLGLAALALGALAVGRGDGRGGWLLLALVLFLLANAAICSLGSTTHDRYQGRVAWLLVPGVVLAGWSAARGASRGGGLHPAAWHGIVAAGRRST